MKIKFFVAGGLLGEEFFRFSEIEAEAVKDITKEEIRSYNRQLTLDWLKVDISMIHQKGDSVLLSEIKLFSEESD